MNPLNALPQRPDLERLLLSRPAAEVAAVLAALAAEPLEPAATAGLAFAEGSLALRDGRLDEAKQKLEQAAAAFAALGEVEASEYCLIEASVARTRRGRRELAEEALALVTPLFESAFEGVRVRALLVKGSALRVMGQAAAAQAAFVVALELSRGFPETRSMVLNSLGTISVTLGAFGAATSLCEHAAEVCRLRKDVIGEAIAMGQLGAASLGKGDFEAARRSLSRQEWLSREVGDAFGQTRALVWLSEVALDDGRLDDAMGLAERALTVAGSVEPKLTTFMAYANRVLGRAKLRAGDRTGLSALTAAEAIFREQRLPLGQALAERDIALSSEPVDLLRVRRAAQTLASLGLVERVLESLPTLNAASEVELALAQSMPRRLEPMEAALMVSEPTVLSDTVLLRMAARKNLARLALLSTEAEGLLVALVRGMAPNALASAVDHAATAFAVVGQLGELSLVAWSARAELAVVEADLARLAAQHAAFALLSQAKVRSPNFGGGLSAEVEGLEVGALLAAATSSKEKRSAVGDLAGFAALVAS